MADVPETSHFSPRPWDRYSLCIGFVLPKEVMDDIEIPLEEWRANNTGKNSLDKVLYFNDREEWFVCFYRLSSDADHIHIDQALRSMPRGGAITNCRFSGFEATPHPLKATHLHARIECQGNRMEKLHQDMTTAFLQHKVPFKQRLSRLWRAKIPLGDQGHGYQTTKCISNFIKSQPLISSQETFTVDKVSLWVHNAHPEGSDFRFTEIGTYPLTNEHE